MSLASLDLSFPLRLILSWTGWRSLSGDGVSRWDDSEIYRGFLSTGSSLFSRCVSVIYSSRQFEGRRREVRVVMSIILGVFFPSKL